MKCVLLLWSTAMLLACSKSQEQVDLKPVNVLLILTDDQGFGDVQIHGNDHISTPNMDKLAKEGIRMNNFYVSPVCAPTRASLLTGRYHYRTGTTWVTRNGEAMRSDEVTLAEVLKANGYATGCFGKWHNGGHYPQNPTGQGFDEFTGFCAGHWSNYIDPPLEHNGASINTTGYITDILTDSAVSFIQRHKDQAFFCYVPYNTPHTPYIVPDRYFSKYKERELDNRLASTYGMIESIDENIGRMMKKLDELDLLNRTLIIFITDNGPNYDRYNAGLKGRKGWVNDGGVRVPCFFYWKGRFAAGSTINQLTAHIDLLPTLQELLKLRPVETLPLDGISFSKLLTKQDSILPERTFYTFSSNMNKFKGAARTQQYRLTIDGENIYSLTDLLADPGEQNELKEKNPEQARHMYHNYLTKYEEVTRGVGNFLPIPLGYREVPVSVLQGHEAQLKGNVRYGTSQWGWANDWIENWARESDTIYWQVEVANPGIYQVELQYSCAPENTGANIHVQSGNAGISTVLTEAFTSEVIPNYERVAREVEAVERTWGQFNLGSVALEAGPQTIRLFASKITGKEVATVKALILKQS